MRVGDRAQHPPGHRVGVVPQSTVDGADHDVEPGEQLVLLVERAVGEDVHLDAGEQPEVRSGAGQGSLSAATTSSCSAQPVGGQAAGHGQPGRVVGEHQVRVAEVDRGGDHLLDRRAAVGPVGVAVAVAAQRPAQRGRGLVDVGALGRAAAGAGRPAPRRRSDSATQRAVTSPTPGSLVSVPSAARVGELSAGRACRSAAAAPTERPHPVGRLVRPLQQEGDAAQVGDGVTGGHAQCMLVLTRGCSVATCPRRLGGCGRSTGWTARSGSSTRPRCRPPSCWLTLSTVDELVDAIQRLAVRGAPALGRGRRARGGPGRAAALADDPRRWPRAVTRLEIGPADRGEPGPRRPAGRRRAAPAARRRCWPRRCALRDEEIAASEAMARRGADLVTELCGAGAAAADPLQHRRAGHGRSAAPRSGWSPNCTGAGALGGVIASETRPLLQGARLTAWELGRAGRRRTGSRSTAPGRS